MDEPRNTMKFEGYYGMCVRRVRATTDALPDGIPVTVEIDGEDYRGIDTGTEFVIPGVLLVGTVPPISFDAAAREWVRSGLGGA